MNVFITGIDGFIGSHLSRHLIREDVTIWGLLERGATSQNLEDIEKRLNLVEGDLNELDNLLDLIGSIQPEVIFHLAGQTIDKLAIDRPHDTFKINVMGTVNLLESIRQTSSKARFLQVVNSDIYSSITPDMLPIDEQTPIGPDTPLGASHAAMDIIARQYGQTYGINVIIARTLYLMGPRQNPQFVVSEYAHKIARAMLGYADPVITVGKLTAERDFLDVRDAVKVYWDMAKKKNGHDLYTVCSGKPIVLRDILDKLVALSGMDIEIEIDPARIRNTDRPAMWGNPSRIVKDFNFSPEISLEKSLSDMLSYWTNKIDRSEF